MGDFDISFITNWVGKKPKGQYYIADLQAYSLAVLYFNGLGQKTYNELSPILGLTYLRQVQRIKRKLLEERMFMPGINIRLGTGKGSTKGETIFAEQYGWVMCNTCC